MTTQIIENVVTPEPAAFLDMNAVYGAPKIVRQLPNTAVANNVAFCHARPIIASATRHNPRNAAHL